MINYWCGRSRSLRARTITPLSSRRWKTKVVISPVADTRRQSEPGRIALTVYIMLVPFHKTDPDFASVEIPVILAADLENGAGSRIKACALFPWLTALGATDSENLAYKMGVATGKEGRKYGIHWTFSPVVDLNGAHRDPMVYTRSPGFGWTYSLVLDVNTNPMDPETGTRSFGERAEVVTRFGLKALEGYRGAGLICTGKHFPGRGASTSDAHQGLPVVDEAREVLLEVHIWDKLVYLKRAKAKCDWPVAEPFSLERCIIYRIICDRVSCIEEVAMMIAPRIRNFFQRINRSTAGRRLPMLCLLYLAVLDIMGWAVACSPMAASIPLTQAQPYTFYLYNGLEESNLVPIDPETLNNQLAGQTVEPGRFWRLSADGSTLVNMEYPQGRDPNGPNLKPDDVWVVVRDLQTKTELSRFHPPANLLPLALNEDGTHLVLDPYPHPSSYPPIAEWYVMDTSTGQQLAHVSDADHSCRRSWFDPAVQQRIYCLVDPALAQARGPQPVQIIAYDMGSGEKAGELELPEVLAGGWQTDRTVNGQPVWAFLEPGVALSPDGGRMAVVHADADKVTLIDARYLTVEGTLSLNRRTSLLDLFTPAVAYAKGEMEGTIRQAMFSPNGQYLYVFSQEVREEAPAQRGLWLVDLNQGTILVEALPEFQVQWVRPAPDGSVYVFGTTDKHLLPHEIRSSSPSTLWRLDARSLKTLGKREFTGYRGSRLVLAHTSN